MKFPYIKSRGDLENSKGVYISYFVVYRICLLAKLICNLSGNAADFKILDISIYLNVILIL